MSLEQTWPDDLTLEYLANWELKERDESEIVRCCADGDIPVSAVRIEQDRTGLALLVKYRRPD